MILICSYPRIPVFSPSFSFCNSSFSYDKVLESIYGVWKWSVDPAVIEGYVLGGFLFDHFVFLLRHKVRDSKSFLSLPLQSPLRYSCNKQPRSPRTPRALFLTLHPLLLCVPLSTLLWSHRFYFGLDSFHIFFFFLCEAGSFRSTWSPDQAGELRSFRWRWQCQPSSVEACLFSPLWWWPSLSFSVTRRWSTHFPFSFFPSIEVHCILIWSLLASFSFCWSSALDRAILIRLIWEKWPGILFKWDVVDLNHFHSISFLFLSLYSCCFAISLLSFSLRFNSIEKSTLEQLFWTRTFERNHRLRRGVFSFLLSFVFSIRILDDHMKSKDGLSSCDPLRMNQAAKKYSKSHPLLDSFVTLLKSWRTEKQFPSQVKTEETFLHFVSTRKRNYDKNDDYDDKVKFLTNAWMTRGGGKEMEDERVASNVSSRREKKVDKRRVKKSKMKGKRTDVKRIEMLMEKERREDLILSTVQRMRQRLFFLLFHFFPPKTSQRIFDA